MAVIFSSFLVVHMVIVSNTPVESGTHLQDEPASNVDASHRRDAPFECLFSPLPFVHVSPSLPCHYYCWRMRGDESARGEQAG